MNQRQAFAESYNVPRETMDRFDIYADLLTQWQMRMNLVGPSTLPDVWNRHFSDSVQLLSLAGIGKGWLDIGAGAGFPGLAIALVDPTAQLTLVETTTKKCRFLTEVSARLGIAGRVTIENRRIERLPQQKFDVITARALAGLSQLFEWGLPYAASGTRWVLPKGAQVEAEMDFAIERFAFDYSLVPSRTDDAARIVVASGVKRR